MNKQKWKKNAIRAFLNGNENKLKNLVWFFLTKRLLYFFDRKTTFRIMDLFKFLL